MKKDFILVVRRIKHSPDFRDAEDRLLFEDLLLAAAWEDRERTVGGLRIIEPVGSVFVSRRKIGEHLGGWCHLSADALFRRLTRLETTGCVKLTHSALGTLVKFVKWKDYQVPKKDAHHPQAAAGQRVEGKNKDTTHHPVRAPLNAPPPPPGARTTDFEPETQATTSSGGGAFSADAPPAPPGAYDENAPPTIKDTAKNNTTNLLPNQGPGPVRSRGRNHNSAVESQELDRTGPEEGQEGAGEGGRQGNEEEIKAVCREVERIAHEWGCKGVNLYKPAAVEMVRAALAGEYPCERRPDWRPRRAYTPAEIVEAARWFYADRQGRVYTSEAERKRYLQVNWLLGVSRYDGTDSLSEACRKAQKSRRSVSTDTPAEIAWRNNLEDLRKLRGGRMWEVLRANGIKEIPTNPDEQSRVLGNLLCDDEEYQRLSVLAFVAQEEEDGHANSEDVVEYVAQFQGHFGYDPREQKPAPDTPAQLNLEEALGQAEHDRKLRKGALLRGTALPGGPGEQRYAVLELLQGDEEWSRLSFRVQELETALGRREEADLEELAGAFADRFGRDPREGRET